MNFFEQQEQSKRKSVLLFFMFALAVIGVVLAIYLVAIMIVNHSGGYSRPEGLPFKWFDLRVFAWVCIGTLSIIIGGSFFKIMAMRRGGAYIAESLGGRLVNPATSDPDEKKLVNVVEEMAIASGISVPAVYVLEKEEAINAFAAGYTPDSAVVAVTAGCLKQLNRDELQGVVGHEFSHILNGDMRLNIRLIALLSGILAIASIGSILLRSGTGFGSGRRYRSGFRLRMGGSSRSSGGGSIVFIGLALLVIGYIGVFVSRIIQSAVSRQREFLADASSVQFTRNPSGIANALKKIGGFAKGTKIRAPLASEASHMFFGSAISSIFATHPPLAERIRRIEPDFSGDFAAMTTIESSLGMTEAGIMGLAGSPKAVSMAASGVVEQVGTVSAGHIQHSARLLNAIPEPVREELTDPLGAASAVLALLLDADPNEKAIQMKSLKRIAPPEVLRHVLMLDKAISGLDDRLKLPILDISIPVLRRMSPGQFARFKQYVDILVESDGQLSLFEFSLQQIIAHRLDASYAMAPKKAVYKSIEPLIDDMKNLLAKLAFVGNPDKAAAQKAYAAGLKKIPVPGIKTDETLSDVPFNEVSTAISKFAAAKPGIKRSVLDACAQCVLYDQTVTIKEAELLRAIAYSLNLPMPPFLMES